MMESRLKRGVDYPLTEHGGRQSRPHFGRFLIKENGVYGKDGSLKDDDNRKHEFTSFRPDLCLALCCQRVPSATKTAQIQRKAW